MLLNHKIYQLNKFKPKKWYIVRGKKPYLQQRPLEKIEIINVDYKTIFEIAQIAETKDISKRKFAEKKVIDIVYKKEKDIEAKNLEINEMY